MRTDRSFAPLGIGARLVERLARLSCRIAAGEDAVIGGNGSIHGSRIRRSCI